MAKTAVPLRYAHGEDGFAMYIVMTDSSHNSDWRELLAASRLAGSRGDLRLARICYEEALKKAGGVFGEDNAELALKLIEKAEKLSETGKVAEAESCYRQVRDMVRYQGKSILKDFDPASSANRLID